MNISFVCSTHSRGGVKSWILDFAQELVARDHMISLYARSGLYIKKSLEAGVSAFPVTFGPDFNPIVITKFLRYFRDNECQILFVNTGKDLRTAGIAAHLLGIPVVQLLGNPSDIPNTLKTRILHKHIQPIYLASCRYTQEGFLRNLPFIPEKNVNVIYTGKRIPASISKKISNPLRLIAVGRLSYEKKI